TGQAAMFVSGYWVYGWIKGNYKDFVKDLGVAPIPAPTKDDKRATVYGGWTAMVYANTKLPKEAAELAINMFVAKDSKRAAEQGCRLDHARQPWLDSLPSTVIGRIVIMTSEPSTIDYSRPTIRTGRRRNFNRDRLEQVVVGYLFILPDVLGLLVFVVGPMLLA